MQASGSASRIPLAALSAWLLLLPACASSLSPPTSASRSEFNGFKATSTSPGCARKPEKSCVHPRRRMLAA